MMNWHDKVNFRYTDMAFNYSCFPCCLHVALRNLGYYMMEDHSLEDDFASWYKNTQGEDLDKFPPSYEQIVSYLGSRKGYNPHLMLAQHITNKRDESNVMGTINRIGSTPYAVIMAAEGGGGYAQLILRTKGSNMVHMNPKMLPVGSLAMISKNAEIIAASPITVSHYGVLFRGDNGDNTGGDFIFIIK